MVYERRSFCRYVCPVGGFIGLYSKLSPVELRVVDTKICAAHAEKSCYSGNEFGFGCPWNVFPGGLSVNTNCGLCMECLRTCEYNNISLNVRPIGSDLVHTRGFGLDQAYKAFIMLGSAMVYSAVMLGPWGVLKEAAYFVGTLAWLGYATCFILFVFVLLPGAFLLSIYGAQMLFPTKLRLKQLFNRYTNSLIPLGLTAWVAFSLGFVLTNISYILPVISDPLGWGWTC